MSGLVTVSYIGASILFILSLGGLSNQETSRRGNLYGMIGMAIAILATVVSVFLGKVPAANAIIALIVAIIIGASMGAYAAAKVKMTEMPELVAILHSFVGMAAVLVGFVTYMNPDIQFVDPAEKAVHEIEVYLGILIGAVTFMGSVIAWGKLCGKINGNPLCLPGRHWMNLGLLVGAIVVGKMFLNAPDIAAGMPYLLVMTVLALLFGVHMVMAIGGADMPVVVSMLNSYSGWAAAATGFMLSNDLLIVVGALVGSSGAILSYIMCRAMNRSFISVIAGGFGQEGGAPSASAMVPAGEVVPISAEDTAELLKDAKEVIIIPGYGLAVAQAQHTIYEISQFLREKGTNVRYAIHPVAGRLPGHMNVLLAEARVPYDIVNPGAQDDPNSPIAGMPVLEAWKATTSIVMKRSMASGYAGVDNPLFYKSNNRMLFGDAKKMLDEVLKLLKS